MKKFISHSDQETKSIAKKVSQNFSGVIALIGELGSGKTTFTQGFAQGLGIKDRIISPTFVLIRQHKIPNSSSILYHIDLYRLENDLAFESLGLKELMLNQNNIVVIEWAEKAKKLLPKKAIKIYFEKLDENTRKIEVPKSLF